MLKFLYIFIKNSFGDIETYDLFKIFIRELYICIYFVYLRN